MKTLIINGSPRKNGDAMTLVNEMIKYLEGEVEIVHAYYDKISPCVDCRYCWSNDSCCIKDGMQEIYKLLDEVDNVILASPIYFSELTGELLSFASRLQLFYASRCLRKDPNFSLKRKHGVLVMSAGGDTKDFERATKTANIVFKEMNAKSIGKVYTLNTNNVPAKDDTEALKMAKELAFKLNELNRNSNI